MPGSRTLLGDLDFNYIVNISDLGTLLANFGTSGELVDPEDGDGDNDNDVDITDLGILLAEFGGTYCPSAARPSPQAGSITLSVAARDTSG